MKIEVHYDYTQEELVGKRDIFDVKEGTRLGELLQLIDINIINTGNNRGIDTTYKITLVSGQLNGCVVFVNGSAPENMLEQELHNGDKIEFVYGFCGG